MRIRKSLVLAFTSFFLIAPINIGVAFGQTNTEQPSNSQQGGHHHDSASNPSPAPTPSTASSSTESGSSQNATDPSPQPSPTQEPQPSPSLYVNPGTTDSVSVSSPVVDPTANYSNSSRSPQPQPVPEVPQPSSEISSLPPVITPPVSLISPTLTTSAAYSKQVSKASYSPQPTASNPVARKSLVGPSQNRFLTPPLTMLERSLKNTDYYQPLALSKGTSTLLDALGIFLVAVGVYFLRPFNVGELMYRLKVLKDRNTRFGFQS